MSKHKTQRFFEHFLAFEDQLILIGGCACELHFAEADLSFRVTEDADIVIVIENYTKEFSQAIWSFVNKYGYSTQKSNQNENRQCYRFELPENSSYADELPKLIELFSRETKDTKIFTKEHVATLPTFESVSDLAAILVDEDYYTFILNSKTKVSNIPTVDLRCLIFLKATAWIGNLNLLSSGILDAKREGDAYKHILDVGRLIEILDIEDNTFNVDKKYIADLRLSLELMQIPANKAKLNTFNEELANNTERLLKGILSNTHEPELDVTTNDMVSHQVGHRPID